MGSTAKRLSLINSLAASGVTANLAALDDRELMRSGGHVFRSFSHGESQYQRDGRNAREVLEPEQVTILFSLWPPKPKASASSPRRLRISKPVL
jgi:hypothetical protein